MKTLRYSALTLGLALVVVAAFALALVALGCAKTASVQTPGNLTSPQLQVLQYTKLAAVSANAAARTWDVLCHSSNGAPQTLDPQTCDSVNKYLGVATLTFDQIAVEVSTNEPWPVMRIKLIAIVGAMTTNIAVTDPVLKSQIDNLQLLMVQILAVA